MKIFRLLTMLLLGIILNVDLTSCSKEDNLPEKGNNTPKKEDNTVEHPYGIPSNIPNNIIYYITSDDIIVRFENEDVFGGAKIVSNTYSTTKGYGTIEFASEVTAIEKEAFGGKRTLRYITLPRSATSIGTGAFANCSGLTSVTIPNGVKSIGKEAFAECYALKSVTIPNSVKSIGDEAFFGCYHLTTVTIPNGVESIGKSTFNQCSSLSSVTIGSGVRSIGNYAFSNCSELLDVYCYAKSVPSTENNAFYSTNTIFTTLHVPDASVDSYKATNPWSSFGSIVPITKN